LDNSKTQPLAPMYRNLNRNSHTLSLLLLINQNTAESRKAELYRQHIIFPNGHGNRGGGKTRESNNFTFHALSSF